MSLGKLVSLAALGTAAVLGVKNVLNQPSSTGEGTKADHAKRAVRTRVKPVQKNVDAGIRVAAHGVRTAVDGVENAASLAGVTVAKAAPKAAQATRTAVTNLETKATETTQAAAKKIRKATKASK